MHKTMSRALVICLSLALLFTAMPALAGTFPTDDEPYSMLVIGIDYRDEAGFDDAGHSRTDAIMVVTINQKENSIHLTSVMRDMYVKIPGYGSNRINAAYSFGGMDLLMETFETNFGVELDGYVVVDFDLVTHLVDALGGIDLELTEAEVKEMKNHLPELELEPGEQTVSGEVALMYCRIRKGVGDDFARTQRQREVMRLVFDKVASINVMGLMSLISARYTLVDTSVDTIDYLRWATLLFQMRSAAIEELRIPVEGAYSNQTISGMSVLVPNIEKNSAALKEYMGLDVREDAEQINIVLKKGNEGDEVKRMQEALNKKGYRVDASGVFDEDTENALRKYQEDNNLYADGIAGQKTLRSLYG